MRWLWIVAATLGLSFGAIRAQTNAIVAGDDYWCDLPFEKLHIDPALGVIQQGSVSEQETEILAVAPAARGRVIAGTADRRLAEVMPDGSLQYLPESISANGLYPLALTVDGQGNIIVFSYPYVGVFSPRGAFLRSWWVAVGCCGEQNSIDLAADQCTLYITDGLRLHAFNVCTGTLRNSILQANAGMYAVRVLPGGDLLIGSPNVPLRRFDPSGALVRSYPGTAPWFDAGEATESRQAALMLLDGGRRAWYSIGSIQAGCTSRIMEVDLETGATSVVANLAMDEMTSFVPANAWWAAAAPSAVPTLSEWATLALIGALIAIATFKTNV